MLGFTKAGQVRVNDGDDGALVAEVDLDLTEVFTPLQHVRGVRVAQGVNVGVFFDAAGKEGQAEGPLERGMAHGSGGGAGASSAVTLGRKDQLGVAMIFPLLAQECQRALGQGDVAIAIAFALADVQEHALGVDVANLKAQAFAQAQAAGVNEDEADPVIPRGDQTEDAPHLGSGEDDGEFILEVGADQLEFEGPDAFEGLFPEELEGANDLGAGLAGEFPFGLEMDAILAELLGRDEVGGFAVELAELADAGRIGCFGARRDGQESQIIGEGF